MSVPPAPCGPASPPRQSSPSANGAAPQSPGRPGVDAASRGAFARVLARHVGRSADGRALPPRAASPSPSPALPRSSTGEELGAPHEGGRAGRARPSEHEAELEDGRTSAAAADLLDPTARHAATLAPPPAVAAAQAPSVVEASDAPRARMSLEELLPALVKRIAWAGDRHRGAVRLEIGAGAYAGTTLVVHADHGRIRVEITGHAADALRPRLEDRLRRHGLHVDGVT